MKQNVPPVLPEKEDKLINGVDYLLFKEKLYKKTDLTTGYVAKKLFAKSTDITTVIKNRYNTTFTDLINAFRIREACVLLKTRNFKNKPITDIYKEIGFKDNESFIKSFIKITGITPYVYKKECNSNPSEIFENKIISTINELTVKPPVEPKIADGLAKSIIHLIIAKKVYRNIDFSIEKMADYLSTNVEDLKYVISDRFNTSYDELIREYRFKEACFILRDSNCRYLNVQQIAEIVGYSKRRTLYDLFFKTMGITPNQYRKKSFEV